jgi:dTDP-4-amino-4,6-dideoxygalactose transaminase
VKTLHGQDKDALAKTQKGNWRYDIVEAGYKCNMTDLSAAIGLVELERYDNDILLKRKHICETYSKAFEKYGWAQLPVLTSSTDLPNSLPDQMNSGIRAGEISTCYHLYPLRIKGVSEAQRDTIIKEIFDCDVSVNVHFIPLPMMSFYKNLGYDIKNYPLTFDNYSREISLPVFYDLTDEMIDTVVNAVIKSVEKIIA